MSTRARLTAVLLALGLCAAPPAEARPTRRVFGYLPYWTASAKPTWRWDLLTDVSLFSVGASSSGALTSTSFWRGAGARALIDQAHQHGVRVELAVTNFDPASLHALLSDSAARDRLITALVDEALTRQPGDGVSLDFEGMQAADRASLVSFTRALHAALKARRADAQLSLATPAVDWSKAYDYAALADASEALFIMGYDYHWGSSDPGPVSPLNGGMAPWPSRYCLSQTVTDYLALVGPGRADKILLGLPLYGYDYPSLTAEIGAKARGSATAVFYSTARQRAAQHGRRYEALAQAPWYVYSDMGGPRQTWYDDEQSLSQKIDLALTRKLGGIGFWALGYEDASLWQVVAAKLDAPPPDMGSPRADLAAAPDLAGAQPDLASAGDAGDPGSEATGCQIALGAAPARAPGPRSGALPGLLLGLIGLLALRRRLPA